MAEFVINSCTHSALEMSPFEVTYGYLLHFNIPVGLRSGLSGVDDWIQILWEVRQDVGAALHLGKKQQKDQYERGKKKAHQFQVGEVLTNSSEYNLHTLVDSF